MPTEEWTSFEDIYYQQALEELNDSLTWSTDSTEGYVENGRVWVYDGEYSLDFPKPKLKTKDDFNKYYNEDPNTIDSESATTASIQEGW